jgi:hypothetical protein
MTAETDLLQRIRHELRADTTKGFDEASMVLALSDEPSSLRERSPISRSSAAFCALLPRWSRRGRSSIDCTSGRRSPWRTA